MCGEDLKGGIDLVARHDDAHADTHVVGIEHITLGHAAFLGDQIEDGKHANGRLVDARRQALGDRTRNVLVEAAARDVADALDVDLVDQRKHALDVDPRAGIPDEQIQRAISCGTCKINVNTEFQQAWTALVREALAKDPNVYDPRKVIGPGLKGIEAVVVEKCGVFGCINKA